MEFEQLSPLRRSDLEIAEWQSGPSGHADARSNWVVKDPIQLKYFFFDEFQYWLFCQLDGSRTIKDIVHAFNKQFAPLRLTMNDLKSFCLQMARDNLLSNNVNHGTVSVRKSLSPSALLKPLLGILSIRLPTFNARRFYDFAENWMAWLFTPLMFVLFVFLGIAAIGLAFVEYENILNQLPFLSQIRTLDIVTFVLAISVVKIMHELGHAICCRKLGAECNELGIMFLVFSPCLYCNVSDSWMLPERWKRIAITAAGIYVELAIASISIVLWYFCEQPYLQSFFLNVVLITSVNTILVNGNPLMRYDGYFILSDLVNIPNLSTRSRQTAWDTVGNMMFASSEKANDYESRSNKLFQICYYLCSVAYRWFILIAIFWILYAGFKNYGLETVGFSLGAIYGTALLVVASLAFLGYMIKKGSQQPIKLPGLALVIVMLASMLYLVAGFEIERNVRTDAMVELNNLHYCTAPVDGTLKWTAQPGQQIEQGQVIAKLENPDLQRQLRSLQHQLKMSQIRRENLQSLESVDKNSQYRLPEIQAEIVDLKQQLDNVEQQLQRLTIESPATGTVIPWKVEPNSIAEQLPQWSGSLLEAKNQNGFVIKDSVICLVGELDKFNVELLVDERKSDLIQVGDPVRVQLPTEIGKVYNGSLSGFSQGDLVGNDASNTNPGASQGFNSTKRIRATVELDEAIDFGIHRCRAKAKINIGNETISQIVQRFLIESFRLDL